MGYDNMDHAKWAQSNIAAGKRIVAKKKRRKDNTRGFAAAPDELSPFHCKVMTILGIVGGGIYNAPIVWDKIQWKDVGRGIIVPWWGNLSTFDFRNLTDLVLLCHASRIRCSIHPHGFRHVALMFHPRDDGDDTCSRHPDISEAVNRFNARFPADHHIRFQKEVADAA